MKRITRSWLYIATQALLLSLILVGLATSPFRTKANATQTVTPPVAQNLNV